MKFLLDLGESIIFVEASVSSTVSATPLASPGLVTNDIAFWRNDGIIANTHENSTKLFSGVSTFLPSDLSLSYRETEVIIFQSLQHLVKIYD